MKPWKSLYGAVSQEFSTIQSVNKAPSGHRAGFFSNRGIEPLIDKEQAMNAFTKTISAAIALEFSLALSGCSGQPLLAAFGTRQHVPADAIIVAPSERVTLNALSEGQRQYVCSNGTVLQCERLSFKLYCSCPVR